MKFEILSEKEFGQFVDKHYTKNFFQSIKMKKRLDKENIETYLVGVKKNNKVIAASLIAETGASFMGKKVFEAYKGFILDYNDKELIKFMTEEVRKFLKEKKMANIKSAKKRILVNQSKALRNQMIKSQLKTVIKKFNAAVEAGDKNAASELYRLAVKKVDQAVAHGILHKNNAAHKKSQFTKKFNAMA